MSEKDEASAIKLADLLFKVFEQQAAQHGGRVFNRAADGFLAEFPSANACMQAAIDFCRDVSARNNLSPNAISAKVRVGVHVGDVVDRDDGDILGHGVNIAARLQSAAAPGTILASSNIINLLGPKFKKSAQRRGALKLKNISEAITAYEIDPLNRSIIYRFLPRQKTFKIALVGITIIAALTIGIRQHQVDLNQINPEAVSATLYNLRQSPYPVSNMFSALTKTNSFEKALVQLNEIYDKDTLSDKDKVDLLHQIGALALNRNSPEAEKAYRKILSVQEDPEALFQLATILHSRGDIVQARDFLQRAEIAANKIDYSPDRLLLGIKTEIALLDGRYGPTGNSLELGSIKDSQKAEATLSEIATSAQARVHHDIRLRARYYALILKFMRLYHEVDSSWNEKELAAYSSIIEDLKSVIDEQRNSGFLYDLSKSYTTLSNVQNVIQLYDASISTLEQSLKIEERLARPSKTISAHANLAYANVASHSEHDDRLSQAEYHIEKVREIAAAENRTNREYYNLYILALVEHKRGNQDKACSFFDSARQMWPKASISKGFLLKIDKDLECNFYTGTE